jgi:hypothetical protein
MKGWCREEESKSWNRKEVGGRELVRTPFNTGQSTYRYRTPGREGRINLLILNW